MDFENIEPPPSGTGIPSTTTSGCGAILSGIGLIVASFFKMGLMNLLCLMLTYIVNDNY